MWEDKLLRSKLPTRTCTFPNFFATEFMYQTINKIRGQMYSGKPTQAITVYTETKFSLN